MLEKIGADTAHNGSHFDIFLHNLAEAGIKNGEKDGATFGHNLANIWRTFGKLRKAARPSPGRGSVSVVAKAELTTGVVVGPDGLSPPGGADSAGEGRI